MNDEPPPVAPTPKSDRVLTDQEVYLLADTVIANMKCLQTAMVALQEHINTQLSGPEEKPLHDWEPYTAYHNLSQTVDTLALSVLQLVPSYLPETLATSYRRRTRSYSTAVSQIAIVILEHMNRKCSTCLEDVETADLTADAKQEAHTHITSEVSNVLEHCSRATTRIWSAFDSIEASLQPKPSGELATTVEATIHSTFASMREASLKTENADYKRSKATHPSTRSRALQVLFLAVICVACFYDCARYSFPAAFISSFYPSPPSPSPHGLDLYRQTLALVERTTVVTNLTSAIYTIQLADLDTRFQALELAAESHGLRIDNLVEGLGMPDERGNFYAPVRDGSVEGVQKRVEKLQEDVERRMQRVQEEMRQLRKGMQRMDIRLTKRVDRVAGGT